MREPRLLVLSAVACLDTLQLLAHAMHLLQSIMDTTSHALLPIDAALFLMELTAETGLNFTILDVLDGSDVEASAPIDPSQPHWWTLEVSIMGDEAKLTLMCEELRTSIAGGRFVPLDVTPALVQGIKRAIARKLTKKAA